MITASQLAPYRNYTLSEAFLPELPGHYRGKVRDNYDLADGRRILIASDRVSAFDVNLAVIPLKGQVLTQIARFWFDATKEICPNHVIEYPDPNVLVCKHLRMMPVEIVVRDYLAGTTSTSILQMYKKGARTMYGHQFKDGLRDNEKLPSTIITPTTKADQGAHDAPLSAEDIVAQRLLTEQQWHDVSKVALALFAKGRELAATRGLILVDTKYEFGFDETGRIVLADEVHTPDSSRYWLKETYQQRFERNEAPDTLDKDFIRREVVARCDPYKDPIPELPPEIIMQASARYIDVYEQVTGQTFALPDTSAPIIERIRGNLKKYFV
ncbi:MAG TPA: phosphoribosylaminoimidazolesuccinocarboxamide synthase [Xanthobacteraceae bacterium]|jgi:phosphoribosylaminoimidazole-succinocarboxamide synthase|nr:phosphoribosylaminoimidazolesuccinocarboxamide synthase [Xanthobacteraceae bacterium]